MYTFFKSHTQCYFYTSCLFRGFCRHEVYYFKITTLNTAVPDRVIYVFCTDTGISLDIYSNSYRAEKKSNNTEKSLVGFAVVESRIPFFDYTFEGVVVYLFFCSIQSYFVLQHSNKRIYI